MRKERLEDLLTFVNRLQNPVPFANLVLDLPPLAAAIFEVYVFAVKDQIALGERETCVG